VKPVLGIPAEVTEAYTPFASARNIIALLQKKSVDNFVVKYEGWVKGGMMSAYPTKARVEGSLGGKSGFRALAEWLATNGIPFYPSVDFVDLYKPDLGHIKEISTNRSVTRAPVKKAQYRLTTFDIWADSRVSWILRTPIVEKNVARFADSVDDSIPMGLAPDSLGNCVSSDFGVKNGTSRVHTAETWKALLGKLDKKALALSRPMAYALAYADFVSDLPMVSSRFDIESDSVPFYQILLHGYIPFSNIPGNRDLDKATYKLGLLETGACPSYLWASQNAQEIRDTSLESFMGAYSPDWIDEAVATYREVAPILKTVAGKEITGHEILAGGLRKTTFAGGFEIFVNYSDRITRTVDGRTVAPLSYAAGYPLEKRDAK